MTLCIKCAVKLRPGNVGAWQYGKPIRCVDCTKKMLDGCTPIGDGFLRL